MNKTLKTVTVVCIALVAICSIVWMVLSTWDWDAVFALAKGTKKDTADDIADDIVEF